MKHLTKLTFLLIILFQNGVFSQNTGIDPIKEKYHTLLKAKNQGIGLMVKKNGQTQTQSLGNFDLNEKSVFNIGSATKTFTAILILQEVEQGNLSLTDSIGAYLTPIINVNGALTIETLLKQESGLDEVVSRNIEEIFYAKSDSLYNNLLLDQIEKNDPEMIGKFDYCNTNYLLLGKILEKVSDQSYFDLLRERIFIPLELKNTYPYLHKNISKLAIPYHNAEDVSSYLDHRFFANIAFSAGSIASTLEDMEIFYSALFESETLLKKETVASMMNDGSDYYGLGLQKFTFAGEAYFGHGGNNIGYAFRNGYNPKTKNMLLLFSNNISIPLNKSIVDDIIAYFNDESIELLKDVDIDKFKKYVGKYLLKEANLELNISLENGKMYLEAPSQGVKSELTQKDDKTLSDTTVGATLTIISTDDKSLGFSQNGFETTIAKVE